MLAVLHTSPTHVPVFDALRDDEAPALKLRHLVHPELLDRAREAGPEAVSDDVRGALTAAVAEGATAALCTCSTIGGVAEAAAADLGVPVLRVDRPMAAAAVAGGERITVLASVASTLAPTAALIEEEAERAGRRVVVRTHVVPGAWERFEADDHEGYLDAIAEAVREADTDGSAVTVNEAVDGAPGGTEGPGGAAAPGHGSGGAAAPKSAHVIVLAQASMAPAAERADVRTEVLASPRAGLRAAARAAGVMTR
ncbi:arylsulfatase [Streptomyces sp. Ru73]|uniref:arylsulfatase n=1 Tax=Streptomyces sp. Ru73 TaxID=2080748 RepID=UPI000CDDB8E0|nr:arylsulfatase [Streptomyces sp. Ru73]POX37774.1 arylsulfatase [Streptomyces sp. Ru73]